VEFCGLWNLGFTELGFFSLCGYLVKRWWRRGNGGIGRRELYTTPASLVRRGGGRNYAQVSLTHGDWLAIAGEQVKTDTCKSREFCDRDKKPMPTTSDLNSLCFYMY